MAIHLFSTIVSRTVPSTYYLPAFLTILSITIIRAYAQGRHTNRDRDLHARTVVLTGAFTPLGLTLLEFLAKRGAHIIALVPTPSLTSHYAEILTLLRDTTANEAIYAEPCPLDSPAQIKKFCERFVNTAHETDMRIDALIFAHEYRHVGAWGVGFENVPIVREEENIRRDEAAMATFLLATLLLPAMLVAPIERDIRIINIANPFYAAAAPAFDPKLSSSMYTLSKAGETDKLDTNEIRNSRKRSTWSLEGQRALRSAVFMRHLQRILDALPEHSSTPMSSLTNASSGFDMKSPLWPKPHPSNILAITVTPGISRADTVAPYLFPPSPNCPRSITRQWVAIVFYICLQPLLHIFTKSPTSALQSVRHVLCVPKPIRRRRTPVAEEPAQPPSQSQPLAGQSALKSVKQQAEEVLVAGALYADCAVVRPSLCIVSKAAPTQADGGGTRNRKSEDADQFDLGLGDEPLGRAVWEALEEGVKIWGSNETKKALHTDHDSIETKETANG